MIRRTRLKRSVPPKKRRSKPRRGQPTKDEKAAIRLAVYERARGRCELRLHKDCTRDRVLPWDGDVFERGHLVHLKSRGAGGGWDMANLMLGCPACHLGSMHSEGKKPTLCEDCRRTRREAAAARRKKDGSE